ncbi:MAG: carboxypeptidase-like regulatory protein [Chitinophagaceae bacterium]|jgi:hypothetical protein|nr:carboxypeptidase-like regulatory protein [Chitinophagaceae bacterium]
MKRLLRYTLIILSCFFATRSAAQSTNTKTGTEKNTGDSVIQLYGVVMTADSLRALPGASVIVVGKGRGTIANEYGVFSIAVLKGDEILFSYVGFKDKSVNIPANLTDNQYSLVQLMVNDTTYLPATIIRTRPTRAQFERDFVNTRIPDDDLEIARKNTEEAKRKVLIASLPPDGREAVNQQLRTQAAKAYYAGQTPPMQVFNPAAWAEFIEAWKRGDFRKKK